MSDRIKAFRNTYQQAPMYVILHHLLIIANGAHVAPFIRQSGEHLSAVLKTPGDLPIFPPQGHESALGARGFRGCRLVVITQRRAAAWDVITRIIIAACRLVVPMAVGTCRWNAVLLNHPDAEAPWPIATAAVPAGLF